MKTYLFKTALVALTVTQLFIACSEDNEITPDARGRFENGVLVINEGNFGGSNGSISFYDQDSNKVILDVFQNNNNGAIIGATVISTTIIEENAFIVTNNPDKIELVSLENFSAITNSIISDDLVQPRQMVIAGNKAFITCWGGFSENFTLPDSYLAVMDLQTFEITKKIDIGDGAEGIILAADKIFVADNYSNTISIIDPDTESLIDQVEVLERPENFVMDVDGNLWIACEGPLFGEPEGGLVYFDPVNEDVINSWVSPENAPVGKIAINGAGNAVYYLTGAAYPDPGTDIFMMEINATSLPSSPVVSGQNYYGLGIDPDDGNIYIGDAAGFSIDGNVLIYSNAGEFIEEFEAGRGPSDFKFL